MISLYSNCFFKTATLLPLLIILIVTYTQANSSNTSLALREEFSRKAALFAMNVYSKLSKPNENIIFSPFSIQTCVAMARIGAEGQTAAEMDRGLGLVSNDVTTIAETFNSVLSQYQNSKILQIANKIYVMTGHSAQPTFNELISKQFYSSLDEINFIENQAAAKTINSWVESKTNHLIKDIISPDALNNKTRLVLINAIYFKGIWKNKFQEWSTKDEFFYLNDEDKVKVPMMQMQTRFRYANLTEMNAAALEMPYEDSDLSMLIILPNTRTGLTELEAKMESTQLEDIIKRLQFFEVIVQMPRFKTESYFELNEPLKELGMKRMFTDEAEFGKMLASPEELKVSKVVHKAFIEVKEEGTEAAAVTTVVQMMTYSGNDFPSKIPEMFIADKPFYYIIKNIGGIPLFTGKLIKF